LKIGKLTYRVALEFRTRKFALSPVNEKAVVSTEERIDGGSLSASVIIGLEMTYCQYITICVPIPTLLMILQCLSRLL
jgi:hypothetical protein